MTRLLEIDPAAFAANFARRPFAVRHNLAEDPRLSVEAVAALADRLPEASIEHNRGQVPLVLASGEAPRIEDQTAGQIAHDIETNGCWMVLKNIEQDPEYDRLLDETLDEVAPFVADREGGMGLREGFVFLSAAGAVTPVHFDPEHNFLLQVRGRKDFTIAPWPDEAAEQHEVERFYGGGHRNIDRVPADGEAFAMGPGDGIYVPVHAPHHVKVGDAVSVSLSITFRTETSQQHVVIHGINRRLRRIGLSPRMPGRRPAADRAKLGVARVARSARRG